MRAISAPRMPPKWLAMALLLLALACAGVQAQPRSYTLDPVHTRIVFAIDHAGFSRALGTVSGSTGTLGFDPQDWSSAQLTPYLHMALELFGPERLMFGSDWPVCLLASDYEATHTLVASVSEHAAIWGGTACRVYNIEGVTQ